MDILRAFLQTIVKMFAADLWLSLTAIVVVMACGTALSTHLLSAGVLPYLLASGVMAALIIGVARGAKPKR
jgi:hypothetical protein